MRSATRLLKPGDGELAALGEHRLPVEQLGVLGDAGVGGVALGHGLEPGEDWMRGVDLEDALHRRRLATGAGARRKDAKRGG